MGNKRVTLPRYCEGIDMKRTVLIPLTATFCLCAASLAHAHHSHPYFYDQCKTTTIEGRVERVEWKDPHTIVVLRLDDGTAYTVDWNALRGLTNILGPAQAALVPGVRIVVAGNPIRTLAQIREHFPDYNNTVNPNTVDPTLIRRADDSWMWTRSPSDAMPGSPPARCADAAGK